MTWQEVVKKYTQEQVQDRVQETGYCRRCQKMVTKYQRCNLSLPAPSSGIKPSCPMRETNKGDEEKMAGAVSVANSPSLFGERYSNKEEEDNA